MKRLVIRGCQQAYRKQSNYFIRTLVLDQNTFVRVVTSRGIGRLSLNVMLLYISCVQKKFSIYALLVSKALTILNGYVGTCHSNLKAGKLPTCAQANKMTFPEKPDVLKDLTPLEERLISPRIPFIQVRELPRGGQLSIHGNVVNVPADVNSTVSILPRPINESQTIPIKLKRCLGYKHHYQFQNVRPSKVLEAAQYLVRTSELFKNEGIQVMDSYVPNQVDNNEDEWSEFISKDRKETSENLSINLNAQNQEEVEPTNASNDSIDNDTDDEWCDHQVLWIHYCRNPILLKMVTE